MKKELNKGVGNYKKEINQLQEKLPTFKIKTGNPKLIVEGPFREEYSYDIFDKYPIDLIAQHIRRECTPY